MTKAVAEFESTAAEWQPDSEIEPQPAPSRTSSGLPLSGVLFGVGAAIAYTISNACFRGAATQFDFVLCAAAKAAITFVVVLPWWLSRGRRGVKLFPSWGKILWLVFAAIQVQLMGGVMLQASLSTIGIALVVPIYLAAMVVGTGLLSQFVLHEKINSLTVLGLFVLVVSVVLLSMSAEQVHAKMVETEDFGTAGLSFVGGIVAAILVGVSYSILAVIIRGVLKSSRISQQTPIIVVSGLGTLILGAWSYSRGGIDELMVSSAANLWSLMGGGLFNALGFFCLTMAIGLLPVIYVNAINISQAAMAAVVGVFLFSEAPTVFLFLGLAVMVLGFLVLSFSKKKREQDSVVPKKTAT